MVLIGDQKACGGRNNHQVRVTNLGIHLKPTKTLILERQGKFQVFVLERTVITHADFPEVRIVEMSNLDIMDSGYSTGFFN